MSISPEELSQNNTLAEGQIFEGRYQILSVLGRGGVGVVYKARHMHMDKMVAIKTLLSSVVTDDVESFQRFEREARTASSLDHVNIIKIFDFGKTASGLAFLVMEYLGDQTLESLLHEKGRLDIDRFLSISVQICDGLQNAHKHQVIHRDIKPSNIMLLKVEDDEECVKIVDFGLAKLSTQETAQNLTKTGAIIGTPLFMSPEQCRGLTLDNRSDIYSLGCVFYLALTGRVPIQGATALDTLFQHTTLKPAPFASIGVDLHLPPRLEQVIFKALEKDPDLRQQSMLEFRTEIQNAIFDPSFRASAASTVPAAFPAHVVSADDATSARYADLVDSSHTVVSINKTPADLAPGDTAPSAALAVTSQSPDSGEKSIKQLRGAKSDANQIPGDEVGKARRIDAPAVLVALGATVLIAAMVAVLMYKPAATSTVASSTLQTAISVPGIQSVSPLAETGKPERSKTVVKEQKTKPEIKAPPPVSAKKPSEPKKLSTKQIDLKQIEDYDKLARVSLSHNDWLAAQTAFDSSLRLQAKTFGARDFRLFPTLAGIIHCQLILKNGAQTRSNLMLALDIFSSQQSVVLDSVSKKPQAPRIWRTLASACFQNGAPSHDLVLLKWSADFYELTRKSWVGDKGAPEYVQLCLDYCKVLELCGNRSKENLIRAEINLPPLVDSNPPSSSRRKRGRPHEFVQRGGRMVIRNYRF